MSKQHWQDWIVALVGAWLILSTWFLGFTAPDGALTGFLSWNFVICGAIALVVGFSALAAFRFWEEWIGVLLGVWLLISPWALAFTTIPGAFWNATACGVIIIAAAGWTLIEEWQASHA